jgi:hypothetical protein
MTPSSRRRSIPWASLTIVAFLARFLSLLALGRDETWEYAVQLSASVQSSPAQISLSWVQDSIATPVSYTVSRKALTDTSWGAGTVLSGETTNFVDTNVTAGVAYEYQVYKLADGYVGYGYLYSGVNVPLVENRGTVLLVVDNTYAADLAFEIGRLEQDLVGDGWNVIEQEFSPSNSVESVLAFIESQYQADPADVNTVFLLGHVPVPYSGDICPDEHSPDHQGAWPADVYYGVMNGTWTDVSVNDTNADDPRNWNVPGDGKFDQSFIPGYVNLMVGRVDLANLPGEAQWNSPPAFPSELDLLRQYLDKDHNFRTAALNMPRRGLIGDYFGDYGGYAFAASGWRNFAPFFGSENITNLPDEGTWLNTIAANAYLWTYACGPGLAYNAMNGVGNTGPYYEMETTDLVPANPQAVFTMIFGSWFGDWDSQDNIMRGELATSTYGLVCCWSGSPHWFCQHMALGQTIGFSTRLTQNNGPGGLYQTQTNTYAGQVHIALMGDPTLRMHPVAPPANLTGQSAGNGVQLNWSPSSDPAVTGYLVYRGANPAGPFTRLDPAAVTATSYVDSSPPTGTNTYMVRAVKLEITPSGTYTNASQGIFVSVAGSGQGESTGVAVSSILAVPGGIALSWPAVPTGVYRVVGSPTLSPANWSNLADNLAASASVLSWTDLTAQASSQRFYQVFRTH